MVILSLADRCIEYGLFWRAKAKRQELNEGVRQCRAVVLFRDVNVHARIAIGRNITGR
jgi:hypothetical protein